MPMTESLRISEVFLSIQGEGPSAGMPAHFVRLQGCDVGCHWCDSKYTWAPDGGDDATPGDVRTRALSLGAAPMLVVTGGEPLAHPGIGVLLDEALAHWPRVEVETSGIARPPRSHPALFYNVSPKLPSATPRWAETWAHVAAWRGEAGATFKIVIGDPPDLDDAMGLIVEHALPAARVMLMPEGLTDDAVRARATALAETCKQYGFRLSPRLHIWMWGARRGV
jgi:7-carboxy-7-deazaguanine synthase